MKWLNCARGAAFLSCFLSILCAGQTAPVEGVSIVGEHPFRLQIHTRATSAPETQIVSEPERLVIDIPNAEPGAQLHGLRVNRNEVKAVRISLFSKKPPVTRIVVDMNQPTWYQITPNAAGYLVRLGEDATKATAAPPVATPPAVGWVSAKFSGKQTGLRPSVLVKSSPRTRVAPAPKISVQFNDGLMTIHASNATLSEVLFEVQKQTGAEIAIPSGTEQDRVAADFGPAPATAVMQQLLNGAGLNFVVVGSETDPNALKSVILSRSPGPPDSPGAFSQAYVPVPTVETPEAQAAEPAPQVEEDNSAPPGAPGQPPVQAQPQPSAPPQL
jgi:hypothetical protein